MSEFEDKTDWREVLHLPNGVYMVKYHKLSIQALKNLRSRLTREIFERRRKIGELRRKILQVKSEIEEKEQMLNQLTDEKIQALIEAEKQQRKEAEEKAENFLRNYIGEEAYNMLVEKGYFVFKGLDGKTYRLKRNARLQVKSGKYWDYLCVIKPSNLPLPDVIASVFTATTKDPTFLKSARRTGDAEEVSYS